MKSVFLPILVFFFFLQSICVADEFSGITCNSDVTKAVIGKKMTKGRVSDIEATHKNITLKDLGGDGMPEDPFFTISWEICGREYIFLIDQSKNKEIINDVLPIPTDFKQAYRLLPGSSCTRHEKRVKNIYAFAEQGAKGTKAKMKAAWEISRTTMKFTKLSPEEIDCKIGD